MKIIDLSLTLHEGMMTFPTHWHPVVEISILGRHGIEGRETRKLVLGTHTGTHADAPLHFIPHGKSIDEIPLDTLVGEASVINFAPAQPNQEIGVTALKEKLGTKVPTRIILRTDWSDHFGQMSYYNNYPFFSREAARWLVDSGCRLIAMDTPSPDNPAHSRASGNDSPNHKILLGAEVMLVEYLCNLRALSKPVVELVVLPLKIKGADGSPARCIAIER
ncbi:MAG: cyclase family protein [Terriglobales bacterium]